ncbi:MAG: type II toxin-antitoxin system VapC family toxin [Candidatus Dormibacteraeota bacterium]|nr:type II toxin-antitoxin system VapC family toxin [Candidatus Dormibacteraeota bacterium]
MTYLLDTNACIALINGRPLSVRTRFAVTSAHGEVMAMSSIVLYELWYGVAKSERRAANADRVRAFLSGPMEVVDFGPEDARHAGDIRAIAETVGQPLGAYDLLIAAQAMRLGALLVTANQREFARVPGLRWEDWTT